MKKPTNIKTIVVPVLLLVSSYLFAQNYEPFTPRFNEDLKGDIVLIGNNILGPDNNAFNDNTVFNHNVNMRYIDIDGDPTTYSSSSADLDIPNSGCYQIIYAGLYWSAVTNGPESITDVKFRGPTGGYNDVSGTIIYEANGVSVDGGNSFSYACFADVTDIVRNLGTDLGTYTVANVSSAEGETATFTPFNGTGYSAGWSLFVVYEDPVLPGKSITSFDGFSAISVAGGNPQLDIPVSGFRTIPAPAPVRANFAFATIEGDNPIPGDGLSLNGVSLSTVDRPVDNFFNSSVTQLNATPVNNRMPNSTNTLGFDTGVMAVPNPNNSVIANDATSATISLETSGDTYFQYFFALAVDIIEPNIVLTKVVEDPMGNDIGGQLVNLGDELNYVIGFQNTGNDDATNLIIRDILPINIEFNYPEDIVSLPAGVTVQSYDVVTRELIFSVDNSVVEENDPVLEIIFKVQVVSSCSLLTDACSNIISNQAFSIYNGTLNPAFTISDDPSFSSNTGCLFTPGATNFLADLNCTFNEDVILCGASTTLTAGDGYDSYSWSTNPSGTPVIGTSQTITVTETGIYYVQNTAIAPCQSTSQQFNVITFGANVTNPVLAYADQIVTCPDDGKLLPNIFLCGANDLRFIQTGITDTTSIIWERLDETSCAAVVNPDCANEDSSCVWNEVANGPDYLVDTAGQYRLTLNYSGGCFNQFFFNVYENLLVPNVNAQDIICTTPGQITVGGVPSGYEFSIDGTNYQPSNVFSVAVAGIYTVYIRQIGVTPNPCIFTVPDVQIRDRDFTVSTIIEQPLCYGELGNVTIAANDVDPQYSFSISNGGTLVNSVGPIQESDYTFNNLNPGIYTVNVSTENGCVYSGDIEIIEPPLLTVTAALTTPLTCTDGEITIYPEGGTPPYFYFINSTTDFQTTPIVPVTSPGVYDITVIDSNNCSAMTSITVEVIPEPDFTISQTNILCSGSDNGSINIDVINANGNSIMYSIDNGVTYVNSSVFTELPAGNYEVIIQYSVNTQVCITEPQTIIITETSPIVGGVSLSAPYTCNSTGTLTVTGVSGGIAPYTYSLDGVNYQTSNNFTGLTSGTYTVTIQDSNNCFSALSPITIDNLDPPTDLEFNHTPLSCPTNTSSITIDSVTGGVTPLEYQIIAPAASVTAYQSSNVFTGLSPNTYTIQVRDSNNCVYSESYTIPPLPELGISTNIAKGLDCSINPEGIITGIILNGTAPFTYAVSFNGGAYTNLGTVTSPFAYNATSAGAYQFEITDANGCIVESSINTINAINPVTASINTINPTCNGDSNGSIDISASTGQAPFLYSIDGGATFVTTSVFGGLSAGSYSYVVRDDLGCEALGTINLVDPLPIDVSIVRNPIQCNSNIPGSIDVTINSGGVAPFTYRLFDNTSTQVDSNVNTTSLTHSFTGLSFGDYTVTIVDSNGCEFRSNTLRIETPPNINLTGNASTGSCATGATVDIEVITGVAPYTYSIFGQPATTFGPTSSTTHSFTGLNHGVTYQFQVVDAGGCFSIIEVTTPVLSPINVSALTASNVSCNGADDGTLDFTISNYDSSVTSIYYEIQDALTNTPIIPAINGTINGLTGAPTNATITGLSAGNYTLFVREADGTLCTTAQSFQITEPIQPLIASVTSITNATCNIDAQLTITASGGTAPYMYAVGAPGFIPITGDFNSNNVVELDYNIQTIWDIVIRDANGCEFRLNETIDIDLEPVIQAMVNNECSAVEGNFEIDVTLTSPGIPPYTYSIDGGAFQTQSAPFTITNVFSGNHTIEVSDANGCGNIINVSITAPIDLIPSITNLPSCNNNDGEITINGVGGSGNYTYSISPNLSSINLIGNIFSGVPSGTYTVTITDATTTCFNTVEVLIPEAIPAIFTTNITDVACFGDTTGAFDINVSGYTGAYTYEVFDDLGNSVLGPIATNTSTNPETVSGLPAGMFTIIINETESPFCTSTGNVIISSPAEVVSVIATKTSNVTCNNDSGTIVASASGGTGNYEYELTGPISVAYSSNSTFENLSSGTYTVSVRDANGCVNSDTIILSVPPPIDGTVTPSTTLLSCFGDTNAEITITNVTGGQGLNYLYTLNTLSPTVTSSGPQTYPTFNGLGAGTYTIDITDGLDCTYTSVEVTITEPLPVVASLVKETSQTCFTESTLTLTASGGTGSYTYSSDETFTTVLGTFANSVTFSVPAGTYQYYVRDANGCDALVSNEIIIDPLPSLEVNIDATNAEINCVGDNTGVIIANAQGGLGNYTYTLQDSSGNDIVGAIQNSPGVFTELPVGNYQVYVTSGDCDAISVPESITEPNAPLVVNFTITEITCSGNNDGMLTINASGGTGIIKYAISPQLNQFFDEPIFENLASGDYQFIAQDELGCFQLFDFTIEEPVPVSLSIVPNSIFPEVCSGEVNGEFSIEISGGNLPYSVSLDDINGNYITGTATQTQFDFINLEGGDHVVYVRDSQGCESEWNITFPESVLLSPELTIEYTCENNITRNTVTVTIDGSNANTSDIDYSLNNGPYQPSNVFVNVTPGIDHYIDVRHTNGCIQRTEVFDITEFEPVELVLGGENLNEIVAIASGGSGIYEFTLNGESQGNTNTFIIFESGNYTVTVTDSNGCMASATRFYEFVDICIPDYFTPNGDGVLDGFGPGCAEQYRNLTFDIFDRYGRKIATLNVDEKWDGKYNGVELPTGDYWYVINLNDNRDARNFVGHFTLYR
ncbi:T9SS type B sorting domain-containing protein [Winogradskyella immobilis]|uniref:T9SS type B sorting domain-containing protein n=1 Tax=Winogradskyella immobilis TaxID=2816852 RepID=A0ABS8EMX4_9FLAO|nr:T9SS type B sorting domain-containing protein [Winogradskyella immobilis]MCC1484564.1 T9SS type B sorting domain-containing protein [Winogradskyella immobilis]MCG0016656.1 T9SS type B sorting domain-containing protein [Winogradskyella immobilis]